MKALFLWAHFFTPSNSLSLCSTSAVSTGGIFLPNPCDFFSWIFHGGNVWHVSVFSCPLTMQIRVLSEIVPARGRREVAGCGEEGLTRDLGWKLCVSLQLLFSPGWMVWIACDWCAVINHTVSFPSSEKQTELGTEKLTFQSTVVYIIVKVLSTQLYLVQIYTAPCLLHGKSLPKDIFIEGKN